MKKLEINDWVKYEGSSYIITEIEFVEYSRGEEVYTYKGVNAYDENDIISIDPEDISFYLT